MEDKDSYDPMVDKCDANLTKQLGCLIQILPKIEELKSQLSTMTALKEHAEAIVRWDNKILAELVALKNGEKEMTDTKLSPEQVENWRKVLLGMIGPYAVIMPVEEIQKFRDKMQAGADCDSNRLQLDKVEKDNGTEHRHVVPKFPYNSEHPYQDIKKENKNE